MAANAGYGKLLEAVAATLLEQKSGGELMQRAQPQSGAGLLHQRAARRISEFERALVGNPLLSECKGYRTGGTAALCRIPSKILV